MNDSYKLYLEGRELMATGNLEQAIVAFQISNEATPHFKTLELLGECFLLLGQPQQAIIPLATATTLNAQVRAPSLLAQAFWECGEYQRAVEIAKAVLAKAPTNRTALDILAREGIRHAVP